MTQLHRQSHVLMHRQGIVRRRDFLKTVGLASAAGLIGWNDFLQLQAGELRKQGKACILLWMQGGPSQFETLDPKPGHANGGETKALATSVPGVQLSENLPQLAQVMEDLCVIRSMTGKEGSHPRATYLLHTGYLPTASVKYPTLGSTVAHQLGDPEFDLPSFVRIGQARGLSGAGLLGVDYDPFVMASAERMPDNTTLPTSSERFQRRLGLLGRLETEFENSGGKQEVGDHRKLYGKAAKLVLSPRMKEFDIRQEPAAMREAYGASAFGASCLLARRLIESGVTCVELTAGNWDTHDNNFERSRTLCQEIDQPIAQLLRDLKQRGMLERTLVVWMGEFGRTPRINPRAGRDHYPRAFSVALAGAGVRGGQVIGRTDAGGVDVAERPVTVPDLFRTFCTGLGIDADAENMSSIGRPIKIVEGGEPVREVFSA